MAYIPPNPNGQAESANSAPVVIAGDQSPIPTVTSVSDDDLNQDSGAQSVTLTGPLGDPIDTEGDALQVVAAVKDNYGNYPNIITSNAPNQNSFIMSPATSPSIFWAISAIAVTQSYYVGNYKWVSIQVITNYSGTTPTVNFQGSNDNKTWVSVALTPSNSASATTNLPANSTTITGIFSGPINFLYFRLSFTGTYTSGQSTGVIAFSTMPSVATNVLVNPAGNTFLMQGTRSSNASNLLSSGANIAALPAVANANTPGYGENLSVFQSADLQGQTRIKSELPLKTNLEQVDGHEVRSDLPGVQDIRQINELGDPLGSTGTSLNVDVQGTTFTAVQPPSNSQLTNVASVSANSIIVLGINLGRRLAMFYNDSTAVLYLKFGLTASTTSYTVQIAAGQYYEMPSPVYTGEIDGIWASTNGSVRVTELT